MATLDAVLTPLINLRMLRLNNHSLDTLPESLQALPKLESLQIGWSSLGELPAWLPKLPALREIHVEYLECKAAESVLLALTDKGVNVIR